MSVSFAFFVFSIVSIFLIDKLQYRRRWFDPLYLYLVVVLLYVSPLSIRYILDLKISGDVTYMFDDIEAIFPYALVLTAVANYVLYFFYIYSRPRRIFSWIFRRIEHIEDTRPNYFFAGIVLFLTGFSIFLYMAASNGGIIRFMLLGYGVTSYFSENPLLATSIPLMYVSSFFLLFAYIDKKKRGALLLSFIVLAGLTILEVILGRRAEVAVWSLAYLINFSLLRQHVKFIYVAPIMLVGFVLLNFLGVVRQSNYADLDAFMEKAVVKQESSHGYYSYAYTLTEGQFAVPYETLPVLMEHLSAEDFRYGGTIVENIALWVPRAFWPDKSYGLGAWYYRKFYDSSAPPNIGRQFFFLSEGYLNYGVIGVLVWAALWGWFWKAICSFLTVKRAGNGVSIIGSFVFSFYVANMIKFVASDSAGIFVAAAKDSIVWLVIGLCIAVFCTKLERLLLL